MMSANKTQFLRGKVGTASLPSQKLVLCGGAVRHHTTKRQASNFSPMDFLRRSLEKNIPIF